MWYNTKTKQLMTESELRRAVLPSKLPRLIRPENVSHFGFVWCQDAPKPVISIIQQIRPGQVYENNGSWFRGWEVFNLEPAEAEIAWASEINRIYDEKVQGLCTKFEAKMAQFKKGFSPTEEVTFFRQDKEVKDHKDGKVTPFIERLAAARGISTTDLVNKITKKVDFFETITADNLGLKQKYEDQLTAIYTNGTLKPEEKYNALIAFEGEF